MLIMLVVLEQLFASESTKSLREIVVASLSSLCLSLPLSLWPFCLCFYDSFIVVLLSSSFSVAFYALRSALSLDEKEVEAIPEAAPPLIEH